MTGESLAVDKFMTDTTHYTTGCERGEGPRHRHRGRPCFFRSDRLPSLVQEVPRILVISRLSWNQIGTSLLIPVVIFIPASGSAVSTAISVSPCSSDSSVNLLHYALILLIIGVPVGLPVVTTTTPCGRSRLPRPRRRLSSRSLPLSSRSLVSTSCAPTRPEPSPPTSCPSGSRS